MSSKVLFWLLSAVIILLVIYYPFDQTTDKPFSLANYHPNRNKTAPVQCGEYFLYIHPQSGNHKRQGPFNNCKHCLIFAVTRTPPDDRTIKQVPVLWSYGDPTSHLVNQYPVVAHNQTFPRTDLIPAYYLQATDHRIGKHVCFPYRPFHLECDGKKPWCRET